jgi:hypothetical protein
MDYLPLAVFIGGARDRAGAHGGAVLNDRAQLIEKVSPRMRLQRR